MKKYSKAIAAILAALICISMCAFSVYADEEGEVTPVDDPGQQSEIIDPQSDVPYIPEEDPGQQSEDYQSDVPYIPEYDDPNSYESQDYNTEYESSEYSDDSNYVYYDSDGNSYSNQEDVYVGGGQSYQPPASTAPPAALYETDKKIDVSELSKKDWGDIASLLKNTGSTDSDGDDFAFIQKNTSRVDNGHWIIIAGAVCILLSITGFIYLIASGIARRRKIKAGNITKTSAQNPRYNAQQRSADDYDDGYKTAPSKQQKPANRHSGKGGTRYR